MELLQIFTFIGYTYLIIGLITFPIVFVMSIHLIEDEELDMFSATFVVFSASIFLSLFWPMMAGRIINNAIGVFKRN